MEMSRIAAKESREDRDGALPGVEDARAKTGLRRSAGRSVWSDPESRRRKKRSDGDSDEEDAIEEREGSRGGDLFQLYLHQMTEIRLLPREEELWLAKQIDLHR